jgi:AGCS family alanine or glycine:cation symporter
MAVLYCGVVFVLVAVNWRLVPWFFGSVFAGAFAPEAVFGGAFGVALQQGIKRGLMVNEAGQGTITMAAAAADNRHPVEQGLVQSMGVFFDTVVICSMAGFVTVMARLWTVPTFAWEATKADKLVVFMSSARHLAPGTAFDPTVQVLLSVSYALFAFTTLIGMIVFAEISANMLSRERRFILGLRAVGALFFVPFGVLTVLADLQLGNIWYVTDLVNIVVASANVPIILVGGRHVVAALRHYEGTGGGEGFVSARDIGIETPFWTEKKTKG